MVLLAQPGLRVIPERPELLEHLFLDHLDLQAFLVVLALLDLQDPRAHLDHLVHPEHLVVRVLLVFLVRPVLPVHQVLLELPDHKVSRDRLDLLELVRTVPLESQDLKASPEHLAYLVPQVPMELLEPQVLLAVLAFLEHRV